MIHVPVDSSIIASIGYDTEDSVLEMRFHDGQVYRYFNVPQVAHRLLMKASSIGGFVNTLIKPRFDCVRV